MANNDEEMQNKSVVNSQQKRAARSGTSQQRLPCAKDKVLELRQTQTVELMCDFKRRSRLELMERGV